MLIELSAVSLLDGVLAHAKMLNKRISSEQGGLWACDHGVIYKPAGKGEALIPWARIASVEPKAADAFVGSFSPIVHGAPTPAATKDDSAANVAVNPAPTAEAPKSTWAGRRK